MRIHVFAEVFGGRTISRTGGRGRDLSHSVWQAPGSVKHLSTHLDNSDWEAVEGILEEVLKDPFL